MIIKRNILFSIERRKKAGVVITENIPIRMRVIYDGKLVDFTTGYRIDECNWVAAKQRVKNGTTNKLGQLASEINADLNWQYSEMHNLFKEYELKEQIPTTKQLRDAFNEKLRSGDRLDYINFQSQLEGDLEEGEKMRKKKSHDFWQAWTEFTREQGEQNGWAFGTVEKFSAARKHLFKFNESLSFDSLTEDTLNKYVLFLRTKEGLRNSTLLKQLALLKWFLRWATKKGYTKNTVYESFKPKLKTVKKTVIFLTTEELKRLENYNIPSSKEYLERVRDIFLFGCYTGLRYSDICNLRWSNIKEDYIEFTTIKTADSLRVELNDHSKAILKKYKNAHLPGNKVLPCISNQKMNDNIKILGELAGIDEDVVETYYRGGDRKEVVKPKYDVLSTHAARRTFICMALSLGVPPQVVMKWTGHNDYKAMKPYIDVAGSVRASEMSKFNAI